MQLWLCALVVTLSLLSIWFMSKAQAYEHVRKQDYAKADQQLQYYHHEVKLPEMERIFVSFIYKIGCLLRFVIFKSVV